jgi:hypothetical protein
MSVNLKLDMGKGAREAQSGYMLQMVYSSLRWRYSTLLTLQLHVLYFSSLSQNDVILKYTGWWRRSCICNYIQGMGIHIAQR